MNIAINSISSWYGDKLEKKIDLRMTKQGCMQKLQGGTCGSSCQRQGEHWKTMWCPTAHDTVHSSHAL